MYNNEETKSVFTRTEIIDILKQSGYEVTEDERIDTQDNNIVVYFFGEEPFFASDKVCLVRTNMQITYFTKNQRDKHNIRDLIYSNFNAFQQTNYQDDDEWWNVVYDTQIIIKEFT